MASPEKNLLHSCSPNPIKLWKKPKFHRHQKVRFVGGTGKIKSIQQQAICWTYNIEMNMGVEPDFGRVGAETTIVLEEQDISQVEMKVVLSQASIYIA